MSTRPPARPTIARCCSSGAPPSPRGCRSTSSHRTSLSAFRGELRSWLRRAGVGAREEQEILLTTGEAVANAVMHGAVSAERPVRVRLAAEGGEVRVRVAGGGPFRGRTPLPGRGWGIPIMERFADEVRIDPDDGGTAVELVHRLPVAAVAVAPGAAEGAAR